MVASWEAMREAKTRVAAIVMVVVVVMGGKRGDCWIDG